MTLDLLLITVTQWNAKLSLWLHQKSLVFYLFLAPGFNELYCHTYKSRWFMLKKLGWVISYRSIVTFNHLQLSTYFYHSRPRNYYSTRVWLPPASLVNAFMREKHIYLGQFSSLSSCPYHNKFVGLPSGWVKTFTVNAKMDTFGTSTRCLS